MQLAPSVSLSFIVKHYLVLESGEDMQLNYRLFSDGNPGLVFHFKYPLIQYEVNQMTGIIQPKSFIYGQITHYNDLRSGGELGITGNFIHSSILTLLLGRVILSSIYMDGNAEF